MWDPRKQIDVNPNRNGTPAPFLRHNLVSPVQTYSAVWNWVSQTYSSWFRDEATLTGWQDALAARRDTYIYTLLRARQYPVAQLPWTIDPEDAEDPEQIATAALVESIIKAIPNWQQLMISLLEAVWFGVAGSQIVWDKFKIKGKDVIGIIGHDCVQGDKITWRWGGSNAGIDDVPGILIYTPFSPPGASIVIGDRGPLLMLDRPEFRDRFILHSHECLDSDWQFESQLAGRVKGTGLRNHVWFWYTIRKNILSYLTDSFQKISTSGMLIGWYPQGNAAAQEAMVETVKLLTRDGVCVAPKDPDHPEANGITNIPVTPVALAELRSFVEYCDQIIQKLFIGQSLTSESHPTGLSSKTAEIHERTLQTIIKYDASNLQETLTQDLVKPILRYNHIEVDYTLKFRFVLETPNLEERMTAAKTLSEIGVALDHQELAKLAGFKLDLGEAPGATKTGE